MVAVESGVFGSLLPRAKWAGRAITGRGLESSLTGL